MHKMGVAALALAAGLLLLAALPASASASAGLAGWQYQREIAIQENSGETLRDYQVLVELDGDDFPEEAQPDGDDIRFTDADGRELSYWIEEFDAGSKRAAIWVKVPLIPANGKVGITMWYGNPGAASASDGEAVFEFFDDFSSGLSVSSWSIEEGVWQSSNGVLVNAKSSTHRPAISALISISDSYIFEADTRITTSYIADMCPFLGGHYKFIYADYSNSQTNLYKYTARYGPDNTRTLIQTGSNNLILVQNQWYHHKIIRSGALIRAWLGTTEIFNADNNAYHAAEIGFQTYKNNVMEIDNVVVRKYSASEPTISLAPPAPATHTALSITKSPTPHSIRQFQETAITISIENSGTTDATDIEITDRVHPSFDLTSGDFPNPKRYDLIRPGETRDLQYTISSKESGTFTLDPATVTYADEDGNIQEATSEPASIKVIPSTEGGTPRSNPSVSTASVQLHGEKTNVVLGEDILLKLSAVNLITKPLMHVQVIIIPPSGMSVTSSAFAKSGAGQYTTTYELESGTGKDIEVAIRSNQVGDFDVNGRIIYYFGDDREDAEDHTLILPITVRAEAEPGVGQTADTLGSEDSNTPGFAAVVAITGLLAAYLRRRI